MSKREIIYIYIYQQPTAAVYNQWSFDQLIYCEQRERRIRIFQRFDISFEPRIQRADVLQTITYINTLYYYTYTTNGHVSSFTHSHSCVRQHVKCVLLYFISIGNQERIFHIIMCSTVYTDDVHRPCSTLDDFFLSDFQFADFH